MSENAIKWFYCERSSHLKAAAEAELKTVEPGELVQVLWESAPRPEDYPCIVSLHVNFVGKSMGGETWQLSFVWVDRQTASEFVRKSQLVEAVSVEPVKTEPDSPVAVELGRLMTRFNEVARMLSEQDEYNRQMTAWLYSLTELAVEDGDISSIERTFYKYQRYVDEAITKAKDRLGFSDVVNGIQGLKDAEDTEDEP